MTIAHLWNSLNLAVNRCLYHRFANPTMAREYARGLEDLAEAILKNKPHRASGEHAAHIIEIMEAIDTSIATKQTVDVHSNFIQPEMMDWVF